MIGMKPGSSAVVAGGLSLMIVLGGASPATAPAGARAPGTFGRTAPVTAPDEDTPPRFDIGTLRPGTAPGLLFSTPQFTLPPVGEPLPEYRQPHGPVIFDNRGRAVWFQRLPRLTFATDLRVQRYQGRKVLTWWEGTVPGTGGGLGVGHIMDEHYRPIATVGDSNVPIDLHEFKISSRDTALTIGYRMVPADLTAVGGPKEGTVVDCVIEEVDIATGKKLLSWSSLEHVPVDQSDAPVSSYVGKPYDYFHANSLTEDDDGNLLIGSRHLSTVFKVDRRTGKIIWRLGGRKSDFPLGIGVRFGWQHNVNPEGHNTFRIFDNQTIQAQPGYESRVAWIKIDPVRRTTRLVRQLTHPEHLSTTHEGGAQSLPGGNTAVSWGAAGRISEFSRRGTLLFDAKLAKGWTAYRLYRFPWTGRPVEAPTVGVKDGSVHAVWNGATGVARWRILGGAAPGALQPFAEAEWNGLDTAVAPPSPGAAMPHYLKAEALDRSGKVIGSSTVTQNTGMS